jgi:hypothetical protein
MARREGELVGNWSLINLQNHANLENLLRILMANLPDHLCYILAFCVGWQLLKCPQWQDQLEGQPKANWLYKCHLLANFGNEQKEWWKLRL